MIEDPTSPAAILRALGRVLRPEEIDELWIFPTRRIGGGHSTVVVASAFEARPGDSSPAPSEREDPAAGAGEPGPSGSSASAPGAAEPDDDIDSDRRRLLTARFTIARNARNQPELRHELAEHGAAPAERVGRVVDGVFRRLDDETEPPRHARIGGELERWSALLQELDRQEL